MAMDFAALGMLGLFPPPPPPPGVDLVAIESPEERAIREAYAAHLQAVAQIQAQVHAATAAAAAERARSEAAAAAAAGAMGAAPALVPLPMPPAPFEPALVQQVAGNIGIASSVDPARPRKGKGKGRPEFGPNEADDPEVKLELVSKVKAFQKASKSNKDHWHNHCLALNSNNFDPARYDIAFLTNFLSTIDTAAIVTNVKHDGGEVKVDVTEKIFVSGLPPESTEQDLRAYFGTFGTVAEVQLKTGGEQTRGYAFVTFSKVSEAQAVLDNYMNNMLHGKWIECKAAMPRSERQEEQAKGSKGSKGKGQDDWFAAMAAMFGKGASPSCSSWGGKGDWGAGQGKGDWGAGKGNSDWGAGKGKDDWGAGKGKSDWGAGKGKGAWGDWGMGDWGPSPFWGWGKGDWGGKAGWGPPPWWGGGGWGGDWGGGGDWSDWWSDWASWAPPWGPWCCGGKGCQGKGGKGGGACGGAGDGFPRRPRGEEPEAKSRRPKASERSLSDQVAQGDKIFVGALPKSADEEKIAAYFSQFGNLLRVDLKMDQAGVSKGFAFLTYESMDSVQAVLDAYERHTIDGKWVDCKNASQQADPSKAMIGVRKDIPPPTGTALRAQGLPFKASPKEILQFFAAYGPVRATVIADQNGRPSGNAVVEFRDEASCLSAWTDKQGATMEHRYVELFGASAEDMARLQAQPLATTDASGFAGSAYGAVASGLPPPPRVAPY